MNLRTFYLSALLCTVCMIMKAQPVVNVWLTNESEQNFSISDNGKIYFSNSELFIDQGDGSSEFSFPLSSIQHISFTNTSAIGSILNQKSMCIYPNPASSTVRILTGTTESKELVIYSIDGRAVLRQKYSDNTPINISSLRAGFYIVKVDNTTLKLCKQ